MSSGLRPTVIDADLLMNLLATDQHACGQRGQGHVLRLALLTPRDGTGFVRQRHRQRLSHKRRQHHPPKRCVGGRRHIEGEVITGLAVVPVGRVGISAIGPGLDEDPEIFQPQVRIGQQQRLPTLGATEELDARVGAQRELADRAGMLGGDAACTHRPGGQRQRARQRPSELEVTAGRSDERVALKILGVSWRFAYEHQPVWRLSFARHSLSS